MDSKTLFLDVIKGEFAPYLRAQGFKGSGQNFYRISADLVHVINLQASKYGDGFAVNLAIHPLGMKVENSMSHPEPKKLKEYECLFRTRLSKPTETDRWWKHRGFLKSPERAARSLIQLYKRYGESYFSAYSDAEALLGLFDVDALRMEKYINIGGQDMRNGRAALVGAWLAEHLGDFSRVAELASLAEANKWKQWSYSSEVERLNLIAQQGGAAKTDPQA